MPVQLVGTQDSPLVSCEISVRGGRADLTSCVPPQVQSPCDCGEGFQFDLSAKICQSIPAPSNQCKPSEW